MVLQKHELNGSEKRFTDIGVAQSFSKINTHLAFSIVPSPLAYYLNFNVTTASTIVKIVTTQNLTAILLSWYPNF
jgi:hypothetical protein